MFTHNVLDVSLLTINYSYLRDLWEFLGLLSHKITSVV